MEKKENVYEKTEGTGEGIEMENGAKEDCRTSAPTVPTKFKDVDALVRAYSALQSEFTRRSQRLKELERKVENLEGESLTGGSGVEKLRKNAQARKAEMQRFDHFVAETERVGTQEEGQANTSDGQENALEKAAAKDGALENTTVAETVQDGAADLEKPTKEQPLEETSGMENGENGDTMYALKSSANAPAQVENDVGGRKTAEDAVKGMDMQAQEGEKVATVAGSMPNVPPSETLYAQVCRDEKVRLRIIGEYLSSLGKSSAPLMTGGVGAFTTPPFRAANITEAGNMALLYFKKPLEK